MDWQRKQVVPSRSWWPMDERFTWPGRPQWMPGPETPPAQRYLRDIRIACLRDIRFAAVVLAACAVIWTIVLLASIAADLSR